MKKLPKVDVSFENLYRMLIAPIRSKLLLAGIEIKVFSQLSEPKSAEAVAEAIGAHTVNTRRFLDGLTASDLVVKKKGLYQNTPVTQTFLVEGKPTFLGRSLTLQTETWDAVLNDLPKLVKEGPPPPSPESDPGAEEMSEQFTASHAITERAGIAQRVAEIISELREFSSFRKMLDLGGGPGLNGISIVGAHPNMSGVIFDRPAIVKVAETFVREYEMEDRIEVMGGDYLQDSIGEGYDLILACDTLYYGKDDMESIMKKIYDALKPAGVFVSIYGVLTHERTKPENMMLGILPEAMMGYDTLPDQGFIADSMLHVGFRSVRSCTIDIPMGPMDMDIARKA